MKWNTLIWNDGSTPVGARETIRAYYFFKMETSVSCHEFWAALDDVSLIYSTDQIRLWENLRKLHRNKLHLLLVYIFFTLNWPKGGSTVGSSYYRGGGHLKHSQSLCECCLFRKWLTLQASWFKKKQGWHYYNRENKRATKSIF